MGTKGTHKKQKNHPREVNPTTVAPALNFPPIFFVAEALGTSLLVLVAAALSVVVITVSVAATVLGAIYFESACTLSLTTSHLLLERYYVFRKSTPQVTKERKQNSQYSPPNLSSSPNPRSQ